MEKDLATGDQTRDDTMECQHARPIASLWYQDDQGGGDIKLPIYPGQDLYVGRIEHQQRSFEIDNRMVSKRHFRMYSIIYDSHDEFQPLIYCEDLESTNGTYVNDVLIGKKGRERVGHLLNHDDVIEIKPSWRFRFDQPPYATSPRSLVVKQDLCHFNDRYKVSYRCLGKGQFGAVYLAHELSPELSYSMPKQLACKIVDIHQAVDNLQADSPPISSDTGLKSLTRPKSRIEKVVREIKILSKLSHPNIINLKKTFCSKTHLYIFTELASAGDLFSYIEAKGGHISDLESRVIARQVFLAVQYMHKQGIAHRDIKPENILMIQKEFGSRVVLTDFGYANHVHRSTGRLLSKVGTSGFVAPEVDLIDEKTSGYTMSADLWSLGVLTICLLTGNTIIPQEEFSQNSQQEIANRFMSRYDEHTKDRWQYITTRAYDFIQKVILMRPEKRMTIDQALEHPWFTEPGVEAKLIVEAYERVIKFWQKRHEDSEVIEYLPGRMPVVDANVEERREPRLRRKIPDISPSPYFGLDRHLGPKITSQRKAVLEEINNSGTRFLVSDEHKRAAPKPRQSKRPVDVDGKDIFGNSLACKERVQESKLDEVDSVTWPVPIPHSEKSYGFGMSDPAVPVSPQVSLLTNRRDDSIPKRFRHQSETEEERRVRDEVAKTLPNYSSAKILKDELAKKREREA